MGEFGKLVRSLRQKRGLTLEKAGGRVGMGKPYLSSVECGKVSPPADPVVVRIAKVYNNHTREWWLWQANREKLDSRMVKWIEGFMNAANNVDAKGGRSLDGGGQDHAAAEVGGPEVQTVCLVEGNPSPDSEHEGDAGNS